MEPQRKPGFDDRSDRSYGNGPQAPLPPQREPAFNVPPLLLAVIGVLVAIHLLVTYGPPALSTDMFLNMALFPARLIASDETAAQFFIGPSWLSYGTLASYGLLHGDWLHLGVNSLWLVTFGAPVVRRLETRRFLLLLVIGTVAGAAAHLLVHWGSTTPLIGASAGVSAIMGGAARFVFDPRDRGMFRALQNPDHVVFRSVQPLRELWSNPTVLMFCGMLIVSNLAFGAVSVPGLAEGSSIAWQAHLGGFAAGFLGFPLIDRAQQLPVR
jgi:membrane associated rhomboid family serine protease